MEQRIDRLIADLDIKKESGKVSDIGRGFDPDFIVDKDNKFVYTNFLYWLLAHHGFKAQNPLNTQEIINGDMNNGLYICGNTGSGKSLLVKIMRKYAERAKIQYAIGEYAFDFTWGIIRADAVGEYYSKYGDMYDFIQEPILCIDDVGCESDCSVYMGNRISPTRQLLEYRLDTPNKLTIITSNLKLNSETIKQKYGDRVMSRLHKLNYFELKGIDRRL